MLPLAVVTGTPEIFHVFVMFSFFSFDPRGPVEGVEWVVNIS